MITLLIATEPIGGHPGLLENLAYQTVGIMVVMVSLGILWLCVAALGRLLALKTVPVAKSAAVASPVAPGVDELTPELLVVLHATVYEILGPGHEVHSIQLANPFVQAWSVEGRRQIFQSHHTR